MSDMQISEHELRAMTRDMDEQHHEAMPATNAAIGEWVSSRRRFLGTSGAVIGGAVLLAACGSDKKSASGATTTTGAPKGLTGDLKIVALAAGLENLAVATYQGGLDAATAGKLGAVPPAIAEFAKTAQSHHRDHAAAWNAVLTGAGQQAVTGVDLTVKTAAVDPAFAKVTDVVGLAKLALSLEDVASATYLNGIQNAIQGTDGIKVAASIQPVEMQHAAILHFILGEYPVPDIFAKTDGARGPDDKIG